MPSFTVADLGPFTAYGLNNVGQVVGYSSGAVLWQNGNLIHLAAGSNSNAYSVNDSGQVVGYGTFGSSTYTHAFRWDARHGFTDLGTLPNCLYSQAADLSASGRVVGVSKQIGGSTNLDGGHAFLWDSTSGIQDLGVSTLWTGGQNSGTATAINATGQIVGYSQESISLGPTTYAIDDTAFFRDFSGTTTLLGSLPGWMYSKALDINDLGQAVGSSGDFQALPHSITYRPQQAVLWQNGVATGLGVPAGYQRTEAVAINNAGQVVCMADPGIAPSYSGHPFLWQNGIWTDLGFSSAYQLDINNGGQILVGQSGHSYLLTPPPTVAGVQVNDGSAQRSEVNSISVTFSGPVTFTSGNAAAAAAFQLQHLSDAVSVTLASAVSTDAQGHTVVTLSFSGSETDAVSSFNDGMASLADGRYRLTVFSDQVSANGGVLNGGGPNGDYVSPTDTYQGNGLHLYRLFGDVNGDGVVDPTDLNRFRSTFNVNNTQENYLLYLDANGDGVVDPSDLNQFRVRFNTNVF
jgi:probable HAF family extracellular repeat protein